MSGIPEGFTPLFRASPFTDLIGPIHNRRTDEGALILGLRVAMQHCNARGLMHGGVFCSLADIALGYNAAFASEPPTPMVSASQTMDFIGSVKEGDWLEVDTQVRKVGRSLAFADCLFRVEGQLVARASAVFNVMHP
ncbi:PaaI family thioesterase [Isoalcanivorax indicus]|uniref:PaaI family thioesterase n=1 Tax=Isoalcanivorax indicus TaxID=2202653 RepID=UPI000DB971EA|nr:PaaI family thioesterase [Isoalcanivorax indicus]